METQRWFYIHPNGRCAHVVVDMHDGDGAAELAAMRTLLDGAHVERTRARSGDGEPVAWMWVDETGKLTGLPVNHIATLLYDPLRLSPNMIHGPAILTGERGPNCDDVPGPGVDAATDAIRSTGSGRFKVAEAPMTPADAVAWATGPRAGWTVTVTEPGDGAPDQCWWCEEYTDADTPAEIVATVWSYTEGAAYSILHSACVDALAVRDGVDGWVPMTSGRERQR